MSEAATFEVDIHRAIGVDGAGNLWVGNFSGGIARFSPSGTDLGVIPGVDPTSFVMDSQGGVWSLSGRDVAKFCHDGTELGKADEARYASSGVADRSGTVYFALPDKGEVIKVSSAGEVLGRYQVPEGAVAIALDDRGAIWTANGADKSVTRLDPEGATEKTYSLPEAPYRIAAAGNYIWLGGKSSGVFHLARDSGQIAAVELSATGMHEISGVVSDLSGSVLVGFINMEPTTCDDPPPPGVTQKCYALLGTTIERFGSDGSPRGSYALPWSARVMALDSAGDLWLGNGFRRVSRFRTAASQDETKSDDLAACQRFPGAVSSPSAEAVPPSAEAVPPSLKPWTASPTPSPPGATARPSPAVTALPQATPPSSGLFGTPPS